MTSTGYLAAFAGGRKFSITHSAILIPGTLTLNVPRQKVMFSVPGIITPELYFSNY